VDVVRAGWASASFLAYTGALTILLAAVWLESTLSDRYQAAAFVGWSALVLAGAGACAFAARRRERPLLAGLFAFVSVGLFAVFVAALEDWFGWLSRDSPLHGFHLSLLLLEVLTAIAALWALHVFHHPLLVLAAAGVGWFFVTDLLSSGGNWSAWVTLLFGLFLLPIALGVNPVYGFWLNVVSGVTIGGALLWFWHSGDWDFILIGLAGLAYVFFGGATRRSSWTVLGAFGLLLTAAHFIDKWSGGSLNPLSLIFGGEGPRHAWARPFGFVVLGFVYVALAIVVRARYPEPRYSGPEATRLPAAGP
jgi:hypothetical protein